MNDEQINESPITGDQSLFNFGSIFGTLLSAGYCIRKMTWRESSKC